MTDGILRFLQKKLLMVTDRADPTKATEPFFTDVCEGWRQGRNGMFLRHLLSENRLQTS